MKPLIGLSGRRWPASRLGSFVPPAMSGLVFDLHFVDYGRSVALAGGVPVELTRDADVQEIVAHLDGLVLSGGADVSPEHYDAPPHEQLGEVEPERDEWEFALYASARAKGIPVLAICRGFQLVNVAHGGTLNQHVELDEGAGHPQWDVDGRTATHSVRALTSTLTARVVGGSLDVNSLHHQTLATLGEGLKVGAVASDGVVESFYTTDESVLAVQWHPELLRAPDPAFSWLVKTAVEVHD
ncbi:MAG: gamma-glutamyl-gamma-aminobutyrate hydrolase family protein [Acidimicrobiaceae bacterium]|nr:gamma-glutamyl-gamma-aminobutyrate hydrolase family protein [Acidimicrobiaceae bacterium]